MRAISQLLVIFMVSFTVFIQGPLFAQEQILTPNPVTQDAGPNQEVSIVVEYSTDPANIPSTGVSIGAYWDSSALTFNGYDDILAEGFGGQGPGQPDGGDFDGDPITDRRAPLFWSTPIANWPSAPPVNLATFKFITTAGFSASTQVNFVIFPVQDGWEAPMASATINFADPQDIPAEPVPTLGDWGLVLLALGLAGAGWWTIRRRRVTG